MSKYTTEVRFICEQYAGLRESAGLDSVENIITSAAPKIFDFDFPIFNEDYRLGLEKKILLAYYTREICEETVGLWKLRLQSRLNMIMPKYNQLYESTALKFDPFNDVDYVRSGTNSRSGKTQNTRTSESSATSESSGTSSNTGSTSNTSTTTDNGKNLYSDTPQNGLTSVESGEYLTNATVTAGNNESSSNGTSNDSGNTSASGKSNTEETVSDNGSSSNEGEFEESVRGKMGATSYSRLLMEYRETFLNIDEMVIGELSDLFFGLW